MERFVRLVVSGGVILVAGLWLVAFAEAWSSPWLFGTALAVLGAASLLAGTVSEVRVPAFGE